ncbi:hypothetical protein BC833DRAFT_40715 [Globomyces pollinis-pini]|nr:hypothetical protein BC833DRAFT_40715 [Globomyces pollinis-pini]
MQEITVKQRSSFKHYFTIDSPGKELCWDFFTRKKNISFGLFRKDDSNSRASISMMNELESIPNSPLVSSISTTSHLRNKSSVSVESLNETQTRTSISKSRATYPGLIPLLPIEHYASSKGNVTGSYVVVEPGTFVLVFDNTYSVKTPKKLFFNVHARDAQTHVVVLEKKEVEGWLLKKGNRTVQGYSRRWVVVNTSGVLTYSKTEGG